MEQRATAAWVVPDWVGRVPWALAVLAVLSTAAALTLPPPGTPTGPVLGWGLAALAAAALVAVSGRRRPARPGDAAGLARTGTAAILPLTATGLMLVVLFLHQQVEVVAGNLLGQTVVWVRVAGFAWVIGGLLLAAAVWIEAARLRRPLLSTGIALSLVVGTVAAVAFGAGRDRPPYGPEALRPAATIRFTDYEHFAADAAAVGVPGMRDLAQIRGGRNFVGRVDLAVPDAPEARGYYQLIVIDERAQQASVQLYDAEGRGGSREIEPAWKRYPWLSVLAPITQGQSTVYPGALAIFAEPGASRLEFAGRIRNAAGLQPSDLLFALIYVGPQAQVYWAVQVPVTVA